MNSNAGRGFLKAVIFVGFVFAITYFISYNNWMDHDFNKVDITYNLNTDLDADSIKNDNSNKKDNKEYNDLYKRINYEFLEYNFGEEFYDIYYGNESVSEELIIYLGIINIIKNDALVNCNLDTKISKDELNKEIKTILGNVNYNDKSFTTKNGYLSINYDSDNKEYSVKLNNKCSGFDFNPGGIKNIYYKSEESDNKLYIYEKALYIENIMDKNGNVSFNYHEGINRESKVVGNSLEKVDIDKLPTIVYEFKKIDDVYTLQKITK